MSEYGRLWQAVSDIRDKLKRAIPGAKTGTLAEAEASVEAAGKMRELGYLLSEWADLERRMARADG